MPLPADHSYVRIGEILANKYRVDSVLGVGGMGVVVAATRVDLGQRVALKFMLPSLALKVDAIARFVQEARATARLTSEHVARVYDVGALDNGSPYLVMELLEGVDLSVVVAHGAQPTEVAVDYTLQACEALTEAHAVGIIHRDLKPHNLFLTRKSNGRPLIKVLDFGISKMLDGTSPGGFAMTQTTTQMGSPMYMSPEQMRSARNADARSDVWALGVILYQLACGQLPFKAESLPELCLKVTQEPPDDPRHHRPTLPEALVAIILRCLEKDPARRFASVAELAAGLESFRVEVGLPSAPRIPVGALPKLPLPEPSAPRLDDGGTHPSAARVALAAASHPLSAAPTNVTWDGTQGSPTGVSRFQFMIGGAAVGAVCGILGLVLLIRAHSRAPNLDAAPATAQSAIVETSPLPNAPSQILTHPPESPAPPETGNPLRAARAPLTPPPRVPAPRPKPPRRGVADAGAAKDPSSSRTSF